jgi:hypothetical protein
MVDVSIMPHFHLSMPTNILRSPGAVIPRIKGATTKTNVYIIHTASPVWYTHKHHLCVMDFIANTHRSIIGARQFNSSKPTRHTGTVIAQASAIHTFRQPGAASPNTSISTTAGSTIATSSILCIISGTATTSASTGTITRHSVAGFTG